MIKRILVWFIETLSEMLLLGIVLTVLLGHDPGALLKDLWVYSAGIVLLFFTTGYIFTTIVVRAVWMGQELWIYPAIATSLFLIHFEIMNVSLGGAFTPPDRVRILVAGACIVLACTFAGTWVLRRTATTVGPPRST